MKSALLITVYFISSLCFFRQEASAISPYFYFRFPIYFDGKIINRNTAIPFFELNELKENGKILFKQRKIQLQGNRVAKLIQNAANDTLIYQVENDSGRVEYYFNRRYNQRVQISYFDSDSLIISMNVKWYNNQYSSKYSIKKIKKNTYELERNADYRKEKIMQFSLVKDNVYLDCSPDEPNCYPIVLMDSLRREMLIIEDSLKLFFDDKFKITKAMFLPLQYIYELDTVITDIKYNQSSQIESITNSINDSNFETLKFVYVDSTNAKWILFRKRKRKANFELSYSGDLLWAIWDILYFRYYIQVQL